MAASSARRSSKDNNESIAAVEYDLSPVGDNLFVGVRLVLKPGFLETTFAKSVEVNNEVVLVSLLFRDWLCLDVEDSFGFPLGCPDCSEVDLLVGIWL